MARDKRGRNNPRKTYRGRTGVSKEVTGRKTTRGSSSKPNARAAQGPGNTSVRTTGGTNIRGTGGAGGGGRGPVINGDPRIGGPRSTPRLEGPGPMKDVTPRNVATRSGGSAARSAGSIGKAAGGVARAVGGAAFGHAMSLAPSPLGSGTRRGGERVMTGTEAAGKTKGIDKVSAQRKAPAAPSGSVTGAQGGRPQPDRPVTKTPDYAKSSNEGRPGGMSLKGMGDKNISYAGPKPKMAESINKTQPTQAKSVAETQNTSQRKDRGYNKRSGGFGFMAGNRRGGR